MKIINKIVDTTFENLLVLNTIAFAIVISMKFVG